MFGFLTTLKVLASGLAFAAAHAAWVDRGPEITRRDGRPFSEGVRYLPVGPRVLVPAFTMVNLTPAEEKSTESTIVELVNRARIEEGLEPLSVNRKLTEAARIHAGDMARLNEMEHNLPQADQPTLKDRIRFVEYQYGYVGENIAYNQSGAAAVMKSWMKSPGHKANILSSHFVEIGVAVAFNDEGEPYYCQVFGSPD